jgi:peptidoglycan/LPS O-acetylase OafA/YrhL
LRESSTNAIPNVLFSQNYLWPETRWFASWSLAIEEHFYLSLPIVLALIVAVRNSPAAIVVACLAICATVPIMRSWVYDGRDLDLAFIQTHLRADALCFGVVLGYFHHYQRHRFIYAGRFWPFFVAATVGALVLVHYYPRNTTWVGGTFGFTALYMGFAGLVVAAAAYPHAGRAVAGLFRHPLAWVTTIGVYSYTIYVIQSVTRIGPGFRMAQRTVDAWLGVELPIHGTLFAASTIVGGIALSHWVERPGLRLRERWFPKQSAPSG